MRNPLAYPQFGGVSAQEQLGFIREALGLSKTELGRLLGVRRQALDQWAGSVPADRTARVNRLIELAQFLQRRLVPARIPQIIRTPAKGLDGRTILDVLASSGVEPIYEYVARLASYSNV
ncbi:MAG: helix-turn-helix transcriptional regulator [Candidatus Aquilonibacter sp.]